MEEPKAPPADSPSRFDRDGPWIALLLVLVLALRGWLFFNTEVTARDSVGFIRFALFFDIFPWRDVVVSQHQHPGYSVAVWLVSIPMRSAFGATPQVMQQSAQLVSFAAAVLLALVMFHLGKRLWDRFVGFGAALVFQFLPGSGHHLSDGISDGLFLLLVVSAVLFLVKAMQSGRMLEFALGGALIGVSYLTRPEGLLVLPAFGIVWIVQQLPRSTRRPWLPWLRSGAIVVAACLLFASAYVLATGHLTAKPSAREILGEAQGPVSSHASGPLFASVFAAKFGPAENRMVQLQLTLRALVGELAQAFHYLGGLVVLWGLAFCTPTLMRRPQAWLLVTLVVLHAFVLVMLGMKVGYVSERHVLLIVLVGCYVFVIGLAHLCGLLLARLGRDLVMPRTGFLHAPALQKACVLALAVTLGLFATKTAQRLHGNRVGNRQAGVWLGTKIQTGDVIEDEHRWSHFFSGMIFTECIIPELPAGYVPKCYTVITRSREHGVREKRDEHEKSLLADSGHIVYHWPEKANREEARIVIYETPRRQESHPWKVSPIQPVSRVRER